MQNFVNYDISVPNYLSNCVAKIGQQWKISLLIVFTSCSILRPRSAWQAHLPLPAPIFLLTFFAHSCHSLTPPARLQPRHHDRARPPSRRVPILCGRPRCGHRACHLAARWPCGLGARAPLQPVLHICFPRLSLFVRCLATVPRRSIYTQFRRLTAEPVMGKR